MDNHFFKTAQEYLFTFSGSKKNKLELFNFIWFNTENIRFAYDLETLSTFSVLGIHANFEGYLEINFMGKSNKHIDLNMNFKKAKSYIFILDNLKSIYSEVHINDDYVYLNPAIKFLNSNDSIEEYDGLLFSSKTVIYDYKKLDLKKRLGPLSIGSYYNIDMPEKYINLQFLDVYDKNLNKIAKDHVLNNLQNKSIELTDLYLYDEEYYVEIKLSNNIIYYINYDALVDLLVNNSKKSYNNFKNSYFEDRFFARQKSDKKTTITTNKSINCYKAGIPCFCKHSGCHDNSCLLI